MKRSFLISSLLVGAMLCLTAAASVIFRDPAGVGLDMTIDHEGNVYFAGAPSSDPSSTYHSVTVKYDNKGMKLWEQGYQGPVDGAGWCNAIAVDQHGNAYVTGHCFIRQRAHESDDTVFGYMTVKYDPKGKPLWTAIYNEPEKVLHDADAIAVASNGDVYVTGGLDRPDIRLDSNDPRDIERLLRWEPDSDIVTIKYDPNGEQLWAVRYGDEPNHDASLCDLVVSRDGSVYITGNSTIDKGINGTDFYATTIKYDTHGKQEWLARIGGDPNIISASSALALDSKGNVYVAASSESVGADAYSDFVTIKYRPNGDRRWLARHRISDRMSAFPSAIAVDRAANVYVTGWTMPRTTGPGYPPKDITSAMEKTRIVTLKYDANGEEQWVAKYKKPEGGPISSRHLVIDTSKNIYVIGEDALVIKYDSGGNQQWARRLENASQLAKFVSTISRQ